MTSEANLTTFEDAAVRPENRVVARLQPDFPTLAVAAGKLAGEELAAAQARPKLPYSGLFATGLQNWR